ncbi:hypothetical protein [Pendulispora albinea]|uniref:Dihydrolipoamide acetyltransferase n=1 Tax=Pendulispora albinea TaxID=2741071 RepID=A0ABZ2LKQ3_9BACT
MRRHAAMGLTFLLSVAVSVSVIAQQPATTKGDGKAAGAAKDGGVTSGTPTTSSAGAAGGAGAAAASKPGDAGAGVATGVGPAQMDGQTYAVRLRDLEARVDELKDQIGRSHRRLALLSDTIMTQGAGGSRSEITFHNEMSSAFKLTRALVTLDGAVQYNRQDDTGALADQKDIPIFSGSVPAGDHTVAVVLNFQGNGYGVFTYLRGYKFEVKSSHSFTAVEGKTMTVDATALEKGGVTTPLEQRPTIEWHEKVQSLGGGGQPVPAAAPMPSQGAAPAGSAGASGSVGGGAVQGGVGVSVGGKK